MNDHEKAKSLVAEMTLEEKASLCSGKNFWLLKGIDRLEIPEIMITDGPHGLRKQLTDAEKASLNQSVPAVCFPTAAATACSFDRDLLREIGKTIGEECRQEGVAVLLGPGVNIKRSPLCGRNFEYFSEDPLVAGEMAAAFIDGVQSQNVGVSIKHFAANNQEKARMVSESVMDERTFREIYLAAFERAVKQSNPWTVMCSYNRLFGEFASQSRMLLTDILRDEWGFKGIVMSDWGATVNRVKGLAAGLDLEMPFTGDLNDRRIVAAVQKGELPVEVLDTAAMRLTELILRSQKRKAFKYDAEKHHQVARSAATRSAVLLKNDKALLPGNTKQKAAVIGAFAKVPRYQGTGSSKINPLKLDDACEELHRLGLVFDYAPGYRLDSDAPDAGLIKEACKAAAGKDIVYLFAGLPDRYEAESFDRENLAMPENQNRLIEAVAAVNKHVVVILLGGAPMEIPWADKVQCILMMYLSGEACGGACADLLLGRMNPGGKLAESWPLKLEDNPSYKYFPGYAKSVEYREALFVGYRYYDKAKKSVRFPFGYGLTYTKFDYKNLRLSAKKIKDTESLTVTCTVKNTGKMASSEVVQLYVACSASKIIRPEQELRDFTKVDLQPGESREVTFTLSKRSFAYYNTGISDWHVENGEYEIRVSASSQDVRLTSKVQVQSTAEAVLPDLHKELPCYYDLSKGIRVTDLQFTGLLGRPIPPRERQPGEPHSINSTFTDIQDKWLGRKLLAMIRGEIDKMPGEDPDFKLMVENMIMDAPLRFLTMMSGGGGEKGFSLQQIEGVVDLLNGKPVRGLLGFLKK
jgi:beta-glucosidase